MGYRSERVVELLELTDVLHKWGLPEDDAQDAALFMVYDYARGNTATTLAMRQTLSKARKIAEQWDNET